MSCRILVVDDSATIQKIFMISLSKHDAEVRTAGSFAEALNDVSREKADLIVVDANLPGVKGPDQLLRLKKESDQAPVLLLVGSHEPFDEAVYSSAGFSHYLKKPFETQDIIRSVALVLGKELSLKSERAEGASDASLKQQNFGVPISPVPEQADFRQDRHPTFEPTPGLPADGYPIPPPPGMPKNPFSDGARPSVEVDEKRRGRRAFSEAQTVTTGIGFVSPSDDLADTIIAPPPPAPPEERWQDHNRQDAASSQDISREVSRQYDELRAKMEAFLKEEAPVIVRKAVEKYCEAHFADIARTALTSELRRLAEEKARLLSN